MHSLGNVPLNSGFSSLNVLFSIQFLFSFTLSSKGDSDCHLIVSAWNQSQMTQVFLSFIPYIGIIMCFHQTCESCNSPWELQSSRFHAWRQGCQPRLTRSLLCRGFLAEGGVLLRAPTPPSTGIGQLQGQVLRQIIIITVK